MALIDLSYDSATAVTTVAASSFSVVGTGDGVTTAVGSAGSSTAITSGKWALNLSFSGVNLPTNRATLLVSNSATLAADGNLVGVYLEGIQAGSSAWAIQKQAATNGYATDSMTMPTGDFTCALLIDNDAGTWGYVDHNGTYHADIGSYSNVLAPPPTVGALTAGTTLYWAVVMEGSTASSSINATATIQTSNITGVPAGYTAIGGSSVATATQTTALSLINQAFSLLGVLASGETLSAEDADTGLDILNNMLDSWNLERLNIYTVQDHTATLSGQTLTIGPGADIDVDRPIRLDERSFTRINGIDYGMKVVNGDQYASLVLKTLTSTYPYYVFYDGNVPTGTLYFWPQPPAPVTVHMRLWNQIQQFTSVSDSVYLPQGYRRAIIYSLAEELAPQFRNLDPNISVIASKARRNIKRANLQDNVLNVPNGLINRGRRFNIYTGE